jgi:hypothetical protein
MRASKHGWPRKCRSLTATLQCRKTVIMADLVPEAMFYADARIDAKKASDLNSELVERLGELIPRRPEYINVADAFHEEVAARKG